MPVDGSKTAEVLFVDKKGRITFISKEGVADWNNDKVKAILNGLILANKKHMVPSKNDCQRYFNSRYSYLV